ncbi:hypothetical protein GIB67_012233 [Kingdonia uniflora]|uniref:Pentatricopeptide repeat-containing protein n=1 Tax=Kingdonia uniflora TaxID=39325 RepID=A0A7J7M926_9MAGN|nr:hypothetical protein GIB67_012233 [Kingdonia uniflora]
MIASFAQHWEIEMCLELYHQMRLSTLNPNDYTLTILFSACTSTGVLGHGKNVHGQTIRMGFELYIHVANAIISLYSMKGFDVMELYAYQNTMVLFEAELKSNNLALLKERVFKCLELIHELQRSAAVQSVPQNPIGVLDVSCLSYKSDELPTVSSANSS